MEQKKKGSERPSQKNRDHLWRNYLCVFFFSVQIGFWKITCSIWDFMQTSTHTGSSHRGNIVTQLIDLVQYLGNFLFPIQMTRCWRPIKKNKQKTNERKTKSLGTIISSSCDLELSIVQVHIKSVLFTVPCHQLTAGRNQGGGRGNLSAQRLDSCTFIGRKEQRTNKTTQSESNSVLVCLCFLVSCCLN